MHISLRYHWVSATSRVTTNRRSPSNTIWPGVHIPYLRYCVLYVTYKHQKSTAAFFLSSTKHNTPNLSIIPGHLAKKRQHQQTSFGGRVTSYRSTIAAPSRRLSSSRTLGSPLFGTRSSQDLTRRCLASDQQPLRFQSRAEPTRAKFQTTSRTSTGRNPRYVCISSAVFFMPFCGI